MLVIKNSKARRLLKYSIPLVLIPCITVSSSFVFREKSYSAAAVIISLLALLLFSAGFEKKKTGSRRMVITAVLTALAVAGRFIFTPVPGGNPITAFAVISGMYLGSEAGFFTGSVSAVLSNLFAGQGVWTPFQMLSWGLIGFFAGLLSFILKKNKIILSVYGIISAVAYSFLMDIWTVVWYNNGFKLSLFISAIATAAPFTAIYAVSNVIFLLLLSKPFGQKLERIKIKYGV
ncbi:MAG: ECF transporter S component [Clostridia bacterium]|nr:ECF transporter S component [Clostridia bacterium]